jgi:glyoxylase-like metal-dependent hydrolase (beta-lactamase superfamily II)
VRAVAIDENLIVLVSAVWQTTSTAVRADDEGFLIDSPVLPEEVNALPEVLEQAGFPLSGLLCTHGDWDHLLARAAFPEASLGAGEPTCTRLAGNSAAQQQELDAFDEEFYIEQRPSLVFEGMQSLPVPGRLGLGRTHELELHPAPGHTADGTAFWLPWLGVLVCGDYISPHEIPAVSADGSVTAYLRTLERLEPLLTTTEIVVPGHGAPISGERAGEVLREDAAYLQALLVHGAAAPLPRGADSPAQQRTHDANVTSLRTHDANVTSLGS